jgi:predicted enzyme related to lactoylglutathione lyase
MQSVKGIGGVFLRARDSDALRAWYAKNLGIDIDPGWGGTTFADRKDGFAVWALFEPDTEYFGRADQMFMVNYRVDDLDAMLEQLRAGGAEVVEHIEESETGRFGWAIDPEGNRFELWQPPA